MVASESVIFQLSQEGPLICHCTDIDGGLVNINATSLAGGAGSLERYFEHTSAEKNAGYNLCCKDNHRMPVYTLLSPNNTSIKRVGILNTSSTSVLQFEFPMSSTNAAHFLLMPFVVWGMNCL